MRMIPARISHRVAPATGDGLRSAMLWSPGESCGLAAAMLAVVLATACGGTDGRSARLDVAPAHRRTVVWLDRDGIDDITAAELRRVGVDGLVVHRGVLDLTGGAPVLGFDPMPEIAGSIPVGIVLTVEGASQGPDDEMAEAVWRSITAQAGAAVPSEVILDLPRVPPGTAAFVERLVAVAGVPVVPLLSVDQLPSEEARRVAAAAGVCIVPAFGTGHSGLRGTQEGGPLPLAKKLAPLADLGISVRIGISLQPVVDPSIDQWGDDLNPLTEPANGEFSTASRLDRTFIVRRALQWSGTSWREAEKVEIRWWDASRLHACFIEIDRLALPDVAGWDLVPLPPPGRRLGIGEEVLVRYLSGEGPAPELRVEVKRSGRTAKVSMSNLSPFVSAVTSVGNWLEVSVTQGSLLVTDRGSFDSIQVGTRRGEQWQAEARGAANAVRFEENFVAPFEELATGSIRLSVSRAQVRLRWHLVLSSGQEVTGELAR